MVAALHYYARLAPLAQLLRFLRQSGAYPGQGGGVESGDVIQRVGAEFAKLVQISDAMGEEPPGRDRTDTVQGGEGPGVAIKEGLVINLAEAIAGAILIELAGQTVHAAPHVIELR